MTDYTELAKVAGIRLDIGCGAHKQPGWYGIDMQRLEGVDLVWDLNVHPWPLPDECATQAMASHIIEHIPKVAIDGQGKTRFPLVEFMNEVWRLLRQGCEFAIAAPYCYSQGFHQDPTHASAINEALFAYFDPDHAFYQFYRPKPWMVKFINFNPSTNIEVVLIKRQESVKDG